MEYEVERKKLLEKISQDSVGFDFEELALEIFKFQARYNPTYRSYLNALKVNISQMQNMEDIPCLPISAFKYHLIKTGHWKEKKVFLSSGTTGIERSKHYILSLNNYMDNARALFETAYGKLDQFGIIAVLPSYHENPDSSLLYMMDSFIKLTNNPLSGYYKPEASELNTSIKRLRVQGKKILVFGVSYALLDLAESGLNLDGTIVMETGGMKGRRAELTKKELHKALTNGLNVERIHSEYGMTELLSQCYSKGHGVFSMSRTLKVKCTEINDPFQIQKWGKAGVIECIDLANLDTISFIKTEDLGKIKDHDHFEILGRIQNADLRGCNLLVDQLN